MVHNILINSKRYCRVQTTHTSQHSYYNNTTTHHLSLLLLLSFVTVNHGRLREPPPPSTSSTSTTTTTSSFKRNSFPSTEHDHPAPFRENPREETFHWPSKKGTPQAIPNLLHFPHSTLHGTVNLISSSMSPLLDPHHASLHGPPHLLCLRGADS